MLEHATAHNRPHSEPYRTKVFIFLLIAGRLGGLLLAAQMYDFGCQRHVASFQLSRNVFSTIVTAVSLRGGDDNAAQ